MRAAYSTTLRRKDGIELSIPNIIVAVSISIAIIAAVVVSVVWIVPWTQDNNAQSQLSTVQSAEQLYYAQNNAFGTLTQLTTSGTAANGDKTNSTLVSGKGKIVINVSSGGDGYCAVIKSDHGGNGFWVTEGSTDVKSSKPTDPAGATCPTVP